MKKPINPLIVDESFIQIARSYGFCVHYDEGSEMMCFITVAEVDSNADSKRLDQKLEIKMLFGFLDDKFKVYYLLPNKDVKETYKAHYISTNPLKTLPRTTSSIAKPYVSSKPHRLDRAGRKYEYINKDYKGQAIREAIQNLNETIYEKWHNEIENIIDFMNQDQLNLTIDDMDFGIVLFCEERPNPNYAILYLSLENKVVKVDRSTFNSFMPKEGQIYNVIKSVELKIEKSKVTLKSSNVQILVDKLSDCSNLRLLFHKYDKCFKYAAVDVNNIDLYSIKHEGYYLISYSGTEIMPYKGRSQKRLIRKGKRDIYFNLSHDLKNENLGKMYVGKSLVHLKKNKYNEEFQYSEIKPFGRLIEKDIYDKHRSEENTEKEYKLSDAIAEEEFWDEYFGDLEDVLDTSDSDDSTFNHELFNDELVNAYSRVRFDSEHETDMLSDQEEIDFDDDEYEEDIYFDSEGDFHPDLREVYNQRKLIFELSQNEVQFEEGYDPWETQENEFVNGFSEWFKMRFKDSYYEWMDIADERFYLHLNKKKYSYSSLNWEDKMYLVQLYEAHLKNERAEKITSRRTTIVAPKRKPRA